ncbi:MAG TPA: glycosyltransferase [Gammaproteobacteria bacterium]|nr:glycosyltransferase [Gammaproteobacteria bacterium]
MSDPTMSPDLKVCMPTWQSFDRCAYLSGLYEATDTLAEVCDLDLIELEATPGFWRREPLQRRIAWHDPTGFTARLNPGLRPQQVTGEYDLFLAFCQTLKELPYVNAIKGWKERSAKSACIVAELYAGEVRRSKPFLRALQQFDYVFTELRESAGPISEVIGRPCYCLPTAVDALRFSPYPNPVPRSIDVNSIGRKRPGIHDALLRMVESDGIFYTYDVFAKGAETHVQDYVEHRELVANIAKRSHCFMVAEAKWNVPEETRGQIGIAKRYFEGIAAGTVLLGQRTRTAEFDELFDWEDVVIEVKPDGSDVADVLRRLKSDPQRMLEIRRRNAVQALLRHDWVYRWKDMLGKIGLPGGPALAERESRLIELASTAQVAQISAGAHAPLQRCHV